ncbi:MAG: class I SAM-dependent methyltransferase [Bacteroidales bacterium]|jgi:ubiquinone/menaquinone biosynthesis C-methylase UbiE|nr:class I SAM-dependent methyltransferase [Bacteroidales bacterium]
MDYNKLENPDRVAELNPLKTLQRIGLGQHDVLCDIGAGTGIFTIQAAKITENSVIALELNEELLNIINKKAKQENLTNIKTLKVTGDLFDIYKNTVDFVLLVTVFHEIINKNIFVTEIRRIIKKTGKIVIIEFHKKQTIFGPPIDQRISRNYVTSFFDYYGFTKKNEFDLGDNLYCIVFDA